MGNCSSGRFWHTISFSSIALLFAVAAPAEQVEQGQALRYLPVVDFVRTAAEVLAHRSGLEAGELGEGGALEVGGAKFVADEQANAFTFEGDEGDTKIVRGLVAELDRRGGQVYLQAAVAQVDLGRKVGSAMEMIAAVEAIELGGERVALEALARPGSSGMILRTPVDGAAQPGALLLGSLLEELEKSKRFQVISRPFVYTGSNQPASIESGARLAVPAAGGDGGGVAFEEDVMRFDVTALAGGDGSISLRFGIMNDGVDAGGSVRLVDRDLLILPLGVVVDDEGRQREQVLMLQPSTVAADEALLGAAVPGSDEEIPRAIRVQRGGGAPGVPRAKLEGDQIRSLGFDHLSVKDFLPLVVAALPESKGAEGGESRKGQPGAPEVTMAGKTLLIADLPGNRLLAFGPKEELAVIEKLKKETDRLARSVFVRAMVADVTLGEELASGLELLGRERGDQVLDSLDVVRQLARKKPALSIRSQPTLMAMGGATATLQSADGFRFEVRPLVHSTGEITLEIESLWEQEIEPGNISTQAFNLHVRLHGGKAFVLGGIVLEEDGERRERLLFLHPMVIPEAGESDGGSR